MPPQSTDPAATNLADLLDRHRTTIVARWVELVRGQPKTHYRDRSAEEVSAWMSHGLDALIYVLATGSPERMEKHLNEVSLVRLRLGFGIDEVVTSLMLLEEAARPFILEVAPTGSVGLRATMDRLSAATRDAISRFSALYAQAMRREIEERERRTTLMFEAAETAGDVDLDPNSDINASADYRRHLAKVLGRRALTEAFERAERS